MCQLHLNPIARKMFKLNAGTSSVISKITSCQKSFLLKLSVVITPVAMLNTLLMLTNLMEIFNLEHILPANPRVKKRNFFCKFKYLKKRDDEYSNRGNYLINLLK